ncbi:hypothetical protein BHF71_08635 [Vulcanibacillus modesticaldus]|uniref:RNA-binding S4 domain-containing protein n=1 Tax=Vulcanibacillus modesticaldus TaxID=337097 RepID=A0A1D2YV10_9BACI|nr:YlmH/Sll1252 family protein [Vulcanibacillus modesticaldus]OEF99540.1 hypothetical protein BHF71_08635 [Vulcanibacillus modesticaldus]
MNKHQLYVHYLKEEHPFVDRIIEWSERVVKTHIPIRTDFVDPRQLQIIKDIVNSYMDLTMFFDGGYEEAERTRVIIAPDYSVYNPMDMGLTFFNINSKTKFISLQHRDILGALLSLGIKREKFGDILISDDKNQLIVAEEIADYVRLELTQIANAKVSLEEIKREDLIDVNQILQTVTLTVSSLRVDTVLSGLYNQSRVKVGELIKKKLLKVNWKIIDRVDYKLKVGDVISLRGFGRSKFLEEEGTTKKGRIRVRFGKLI